MEQSQNIKINQIPMMRVKNFSVLFMGVVYQKRGKFLDCNVSIQNNNLSKN